MRPPLSEVAYAALRTVRNRSERSGKDFLEELNQVGLIASEPRIREIETSALRNLRDRLEMMSPIELLAVTNHGNSNPTTPEDMLRSLIRWMDNYITHHR